MRLRNLTRRTRITLLVAVALLAAAVAVGLYGLLRGPAVPPEASTPTSTPQRPAAEATVAPSSAPVIFARRVAAALFDWDTNGSTPERITEAVMAVAEPGGENAPGLYADIARYLPTSAQWAQLREYDTSQRLEVAGAFVPDSWIALAAEEDSGLSPGAVAVTIDGTRVRTGAWLGQATEKTSPITFTVFLLCPNDEPSGCMVLRLSEPGKSLR